MLYGMREGERYIDARFPLDRELHGYSAVFYTTNSRDLSITFGLKLGEPPPPETERQIKIAQLFNIGNHETDKVVKVFTDIVLKSGWFVALPYDEIPKATNGEITQVDLQRAVEEGFLQRAFYPGEGMELAELTPKIAEHIAVLDGYTK